MYPVFEYKVNYSKFRKKKVIKLIPEVLEKKFQKYKIILFLNCRK